LSSEVSEAEIRVVKQMLPADPDYGARSNVPARVNATNNDRENKEWIVRSLEEIAELQRSDTDIGAIVRMRLQCEEHPSFDDVRSEITNTKVYWTQWPRLVVWNGVVYSVSFNKVGHLNGLQLLAPTSLRSEMIDCMHTGLTGSHSYFAEVGGAAGVLMFDVN